MTEPDDKDTRGTDRRGVDRASGILLHPTSLPGPFGCGDLGDDAYRFVDWLARSGQRLWQILPLSPPGPGHSPYMSASTHAGNPLLISTVLLERERLLEEGATARAYAGQHAARDPTRIDFDRVAPIRIGLLRQAAERFFSKDAAFGAGFAESRRVFENWCEVHAGWLDDYALFQAIDSAQSDRGTTPTWIQWPAALARRDPQALRDATETWAPEHRFWRFVQWLFDLQWQRLREYANRQAVRIVGDLPIYCALHSADVWARPEMFELGPDLVPQAVAGVPPDYFSATGQLWGNPLYAWDAHAADDYAWWIARMRSAFRHADIVRIDHFRGFAGYWAVPAGAATAAAGHWRKGPGRILFDAMRTALGELPIIAEDLGTITDDVIALRDDVGFPGMAVLQFAFSDDATNLYLPHNLRQSVVVYTGTHDNDTSMGWFSQATPGERQSVQVYLKTDGREMNWDLIHAASASVAVLAIYPMQDVLGLGSEGRMNVPSLPGAQWRWRFEWSQLQAWQGERLAAISAAHGRPMPLRG